MTSTEPEFKAASFDGNRVVLVSIDGWGHAKETKGNAIHAAKAPHMKQFEKPTSTVSDVARNQRLFDRARTSLRSC
jgi:hypothetical protein